MPIFGIKTPYERELSESLDQAQKQLLSVRRGRDRLAHRLVYDELSKDKPLLALISAILLGAGYTQEEVLTILEETKRKHAAEH